MKMLAPNFRASSGYVLLPVVFLLIILAILSYQSSRESAFSSGVIIRDLEMQSARYAAETGFQHTIWQLNQANCSGYSDLANGSLGKYQYNTSITPKNGSPVTVISTGTNSKGATYTIRHESLKAYQTAQILVLQPGSEGKDAWVDENKPKDNFGKSNWMTISGNPAEKYFLGYFDLSSLPPESRILSASLEMYMDSVKNATASSSFSLFRMTQDWAEGTGDWWDAGDGANWDTSDGSISWNWSDNHYSIKAIATTTINPSFDGWHSWEIQKLVSLWHSKKIPNSGFLIKADSTITDAGFYSSDYGNGSYNPKLTITFARECGVQPLPPTCDTNFIANNKVSEFPTNNYSSTSIKGLTYLPEGKIFKGVTSPAPGAWISVDSGSDEIYMTDLNGTLLASNATPGTSPTGITFINSGTYADHLVISDYSAQGISFVDSNGDVVTTIDTRPSGATNPVDVTFINTTESSSYDGMIALLNVDQVIYIIDQSGNLQTSIDVSAITSQAEGIVHLPGKDLFMLIDKGLDKVLIIDFSGNQIKSYSTTTFGSSVPYAITINPLTCDHVIGDLGIDKIITVDNSGTCNGNFRDEFNSNNYSGNDGTLSWSSDWQEVGESDGPTSGDEQIKNDQSNFQLRVRDNNNNGEGVEREASLSGATSAVLSFDYRLAGLDNSSDYVNIEISSNGSVGPWNQLHRLSGPGTDSSYSNFSTDISSYIASNTRIRFISSPDMGNRDAVWFDNVEIQCSP
jgi:hypothetical protein